jgi:hypothetical protein
MPGDRPLRSEEELTDAWEAGAVFAGGVTHVEHLHIAWVLHRRHGAPQAKLRLLDGTERACAAHGCPEKFDAALTARWADAIVAAAGRDGLGPSAAAFISEHPQLCQGELYWHPRTDS